MQHPHEHEGALVCRESEQETAGILGKPIVFGSLNAEVSCDFSKLSSSTNGKKDAAEMLERSDPVPRIQTTNSSWAMGTRKLSDVSQVFPSPLLPL